MATLLTNDEINDRLDDFELWSLENNTISREIVASNFAMAIGIVNSIAFIAEKMDHHPDIHIYGWNKVRVSISTHDKGGLTELDFELAKKIDDLKI